MTIAEVLEQAKTLSPNERQELMSLLSDLLAADKPARRRRLSELRGLGEHIWKDLHAQVYVDQLRDEWNRRWASIATEDSTTEHTEMARIQLAPSSGL